MNTNKIIQAFEQHYIHARNNKWYWIFSIFCRLTLAYAFLVAGIVKIIEDNKFANGLSALHPMGAYLEALYNTGPYYEFIGIAQILAAVLLLIPRTVTLGALLYFPIIVNIFILSYSVRFEGSIITSPLMVLANLYLIVWNYDRIRYILPLKQFSNLGIIPKPAKYNNKFPYLFFSLVLSMIILTILFARFGHDIMPRNSLTDCKKQFDNTSQEKIGYEFCECIHTNGQPLQECLEKLEKSKSK